MKNYLSIGDACTPIEKMDGKTPDMHRLRCPCKKGLACQERYGVKVFDVSSSFIEITVILSLTKTRKTNHASRIHYETMSNLTE